MKRLLLISIVIISICTSSCDGNKNNKKETTALITAPYNRVDGGDGAKFNYDSLSKDIIDYGYKSLQGFNYKFPEKAAFEQRVKEVYGLDITKYKSLVIALRMSDFPEIAIKNKNYILVQDDEANNDFYINPESLHLYNNYIFNHDQASLKSLKMKNPFLLTELVVHYGYNGDKDLLQFVFKDFAFNKLVNFHDLIFSKNANGSQFILRNDLLDDIENIVYKGKTKELMSEAKDGHGYDALGDILEMIVEKPQEYGESDKSIAFLCEKSLNVGDLGTVQSFLYKHPAIKDKLSKEKYYSFERLRIFSENLNVIGNGGAAKSFTINDPDGYTNLRKEKNATSEILQKVKSGENISVLDDTGDWLLVKTKEGKEGYIHKSRVKPVL